MFNLRNLKDNRCPVCGEDLDWNNKKKILECSCGFTLTEEEFKTLMDAEVEEEDREFHIPTVEENLEGLNRL